MAEQRRCQYAKDSAVFDTCFCSLTSYQCISGRKYNAEKAEYCPAIDLPSEFTDKLRAINFRNTLIGHIEAAIARWKKVDYEGATEKVLRGFLRTRNKTPEVRDDK